MPVVLVTGASTGIGRTTAVHLADKGFTVLAGVRKPDDAVSVQAESPDRIRPVFLDVTDAEQVAALPEVLAEHAPDGLAGLVNNAGVAVAGPMETVDLDELRWGFEVNVFGLVAVTQACLPAVRTYKGRIVHVSSQAGRVAAPFMGPYCASKHAVSAITAAMRQELARWGIHVAVVEPGAIATPIWDKGRATVAERRATPDPRNEALYPELIDKMEAVVEGQARRGIDPIHVARAVHHALTHHAPRTRYPVGTDAQVGTRLVRLLPDRWMDAVVARAR